MSFDTLIRGLCGKGFSQSVSVTHKGNRVTVNGKTIEVPSGASLKITNGDVYINGKLYVEEKK